MVNVSEGGDARLLAALAAAAGDAHLDLHADHEHHRAVFTLGGPADLVAHAIESLVTEAVARLSLAGHTGVHPRLGVVDVVPFVPLLPGAGARALGEADLDAAVRARDRFARWAADTLSLPCFLYGPERTLPEIRRRAYVDLAPGLGPPQPHERAGSLCVGARRALVAYNFLLSTDDPAVGRRLAKALRSPEIRTLAFPLEAGIQLSCNLVAPWRTGPLDAYRMLEPLGAGEGVEIRDTELVGLVPEAVLTAIPPGDWEMLDLGADRTLESRLDRLEPPRPPSGAPASR